MKRRTVETLLKTEAEGWKGRTGGRGQKAQDSNTAL